MTGITKKINIITLGCSKNLTDSEQFAFQAAEAGYEVIHNSEKPDFDIAFVNTCGFINDAKEESVNAIMELVGLKNSSSRLKKIVVFGCLSARYAAELQAEIPEVDVFSGNYDLKTLMGILNSEAKDKSQYERIFDSPGHYAYLKIAEGCNRNCSFCAIPLFKGKYVSHQMDDVVAEARVLAERGVKELILIAQDLSFYGYDLKKQFLLPELVTKLSTIEGIEWIRLHYLYPFLFPEKLLDVIAENPKVCKYIDIPLQHISDKVLTAMNRGCTKAETVILLNKIREKIPGAVIRTTMLVGHPGEGEKEFKELLEFVREQKFDRLGVFTYSVEEGTKAALNFKDRTSAKVKNARAELLMEEQRAISAELNEAKIGKTYKVLIDRHEDGSYIGRTEFDSVEVDNEVVFASDKKLKVGNFCNVKITSCSDFELYGEKI